MKEIIKNTIEKIEKDFKINGLYKLKKNNDIFCIHVNSIINIGLTELGCTEITLKNIEKILESRLYSKKDSLFYREINDKNEIINYYFNTCKNALAVLSLIANNKKSLAEKIVNALYKSPLFNEELGLFYREFNLKNNIIDKSIITHSNLLLVIVLIKLQKIDVAKKIIQALERLSFDRKVLLFFSQDCKESGLIQDENKSYFSDDQALAIIVYKLLGESDKAKNLLDQALNSALYDNKTGLFNRNFNFQNINNAKTSYKNGLMGIALGMMGRKDELKKLQDNMIKLLYDKKESLFNFSESDFTKIPDNSMLALLAIDFYNLKHVIF